MPTIAHPTDTPPRTQEDLVLLALVAFRDAADRYPDLTGPQRRVVLTGCADLINNLRAARIIT